MKIKDLLKKWFDIKYEPSAQKIKILKELDYFDDVWIKDQNGIILKGWVFDINKKHIIVTIPSSDNKFFDFRFIITRPLTQTKLIQNNITLFLNDPCL